ncbi:MAG: T9SS type A sorting domain-containing protein, partial [Bacteroidales bacterium]|nr:T9SS type A sorting domain-containing protein [Bacteroidales bacterium]
IDARESDGFVAIATQGNGMYSTNYIPSLSTNDLPAKQSVKLKNFPNPFKNQTTIEYQLSQKGKVSLSLLDVNGIFIMNLFTGQKQKGIHTAQLNASGLSPGVYLLDLNIDNTSSYHKIIIEK